jgi:hypothetical protein
MKAGNGCPPRVRLVPSARVIADCRGHTATITDIDIDIDIGIVVVEVYRKGLNTTAFSRCRFSIFSEESKRKFPKKPVP